MRDLGEIFAVEPLPPDEFLVPVEGGTVPAGIIIKRLY
jgi:hypothetical protein